MPITRAAASVAYTKPRQRQRQRDEGRRGFGLDEVGKEAAAVTRTWSPVDLVVVTGDCAVVREGE